MHFLCPLPPTPHPPARPAVVVTPLLSLMQDQVQALNGLACGGVPTSYLSSQQTVTESRVGGWVGGWVGAGANGGG